MFCKNCGSSLAEGTKFCQNCGTPCGTPCETPEDATMLVRPAAQAQPAPAAKPQYNYNAPGQFNQTAPASQSKTSPLLIAILAALAAVFIAVVVLVLVLVGGDGKQTDEPQETVAAAVEDSPEEIAAPETEPVVTEPALDPGNTYFDVFTQYKDYVFQGSENRYLSRGDFNGLSEKALYVAQQEIFARKGMSFGETDLQAYFEARDWYTNKGVTDPSPNEYESVNLLLFDVHFALIDGTEYSFNNPYFNIDKNPESHHLPASSSRSLRAADVRYLSLEQLQLGRNEIFARHGYVFGDEDLLEYFLSKNWYRPSTPKSVFSNSVFSGTESANIDFIRLYENRIKGVSISSGNPFKNYYSPYRDYIIYDSSSRLLSEYELLYYYDATELSLARNEIFARHGYYFGDKDLLEYFMQFDWYQPDTPKGDSSGISFNTIESKNIELLRKIQDLYG